MNRRRRRKTRTWPELPDLDRVLARVLGRKRDREQGPRSGLPDQGAQHTPATRDDPWSDPTRIRPLRLPCRTCRRGSILMFEPGVWSRPRRVPCPACAGTGFV
jgi:hypothetical protein